MGLGEPKRRSISMIDLRNDSSDNANNLDTD